jgi:hypothetical protein
VNYETVHDPWLWASLAARSPTSPTSAGGVGWLRRTDIAAGPYPYSGIDDPYGGRGCLEVGVTYEEAKKWLAKIGGDMTEGKEQMRGTGSIMVRVKSAKGQIVQRHALFDDTLTGYQRELEIRRAFVRACKELKSALA